MLNDIFIVIYISHFTFYILHFAFIRFIQTNSSEDACNADAQTK